MERGRVRDGFLGMKNICKGLVDDSDPVLLSSFVKEDLFLRSMLLTARATMSTTATGVSKLMRGLGRFFTTLMVRFFTVRLIEASNFDKGVSLLRRVGELARG